MATTSIGSGESGSPDGVGDGFVADGKAPEAFRTIGEVADALGIRRHVLRYWEDQFPMLRPVKRSGGRRYYRPEDVALLQTIDRLVHREGYTLRGARLAIESSGKSRPVAAKNEPAIRPVSSAPVGAELVETLRALRRQLVAALES